MKADRRNPIIKVLISEKFIIRLLLTVLTSCLMASFILMVKHGFLPFFRSLGQAGIWWEFLSTAGIIAVGLITLLVFLQVTRRSRVDNNINIHLILAITWISFGIALVIGVLFHNVYIMPLSLGGLLLAILVDRRLAIIANVLINQSFFVAYLMLFGNEQLYNISASLMTGVVGGTFMILLMNRTNNRLKYLMQGLIIGIVTAPIAMLSTILDASVSGGSVVIAGLWAVLSSVLAISLSLVMTPIFEAIFKVATNFRLLEICSYEQPLLKRLSKEAKGTFNHSMMVANLSELCAIAIGENPTLARAVAAYHDIGKLENPQYFVENQKGGYNPHDELIPEVSVSIITGHTEKGYEMLKHSNVPSIVADVAREHHGTTAVNYFYYKVQNITEDMVERQIFSYKGPKPTTKVAAIVMIVDTVEAATRARGVPATEQELRLFIRKLIKDKEELDQFTDCNLTFSDIKKIEDALVDAVPGIYHSRIDYNKAR